MPVQKVLFVNSEMLPYLPETPMAKVARELAPGIQEHKKEIRSFMPRYGCINERKYQLHEVIRLSGMNIIISDVDRPLVIKVASISAARIQVYFIDNEDYFSRKQPLRDDKGFFPDNDERAIFYARGVLETVKKLRWAPDIIHCQGWISQLLPVYLKKVYKDDPIFASSKVVLSLYDDGQNTPFNAGFADKVAVGAIGAQDIPDLAASPAGMELAKTAARYADGIILGSDTVSAELQNFCKGLGIPVLGYSKEDLESGKYIDAYDGFYEQL